MTAPGGHRPQPQTITTAGVLVPLEDAARIEGWLTLLRDFLTGRVPPGGARQAKAGPDLHAYINAMREAAREYEAAQHRAAARLGTTKMIVVGPAQIAGKWDPSETITTAEAGILLDVTTERARQLVASGRIRGHRDDRKTWHLSRADVIAYRTRRRGAHDGDGPAGTDRSRDATSARTDGGRPAA